MKKRFQSLTVLKKLFLTNFFLLLALAGHASDSLSLSQKRWIVFGGNGIIYSAGMTGLYSLWYKDYDQVPFHWFDDSKTWLQMDKAGHTFSCYQEGLVGIEMMKWAGYKGAKASIIGGAYGFILQTSIELFDGFSEGWGASASDIAANAVGAGLVVGQDLFWGEQRISMKYGYMPSEYASKRPNMLGQNFPEKLFKDYNAQTYWLSVNISSFTNNDKIPGWLNFAIGYGGDGLIGGDDNIYVSEGTYYNMSDIPRYRQYYIAPDIDLTKIKVENKYLRTTLLLLNCIKFPMPALEYSNGSFQFHYLSL